MSVQNEGNRVWDALAAISNRERRCNQEGCECRPAYRFTWPGKDEQVICEVHSHKLRAVASAMGLHLQLVQLPAEPGPHPSVTG